MDIKKAALAVIDDFCRNVVDEKKHIALQEACRDAATKGKVCKKK